MTIVLALQSRRFLNDLVQYLLSFHERVYPLVPISKPLALIEEDFNQKWEAKAVPGWFDSDTKMTDENENGAQVKSMDTGHSDPLYCVACQKQFTKDTVFNAHLKGKKHIKAEQALKATQLALTKSQSDASNTEIDAATALAARKKQLQCRQLALLETKIFRLAEVLRSFIADTHQLMEQKLTWTEEQLRAELQTEDAQETEIPEEESEDEDEAKLINPKNVPLGYGLMMICLLDMAPNVTRHL